MIQPNMTLSPESASYLESSMGQSCSTLGSTCLDSALQVRKSVNYLENPNLETVTTSFFIFGCYFCLERHNIAWFHLREATTLALLVGMHDESTYDYRKVVEARLKRRLFWLLFVTERYDEALQSLHSAFI